MKSTLKIVGVFGLFAGLATFGYADDPVASISNTNAPPKSDVLESKAVAPQDVNSDDDQGRDKSELNKAGIYSVGGKLLIDRNTVIKTVSFSSATISSATVTGPLSLGGEMLSGLTSSTSGQVLVSQGAGVAPKFQWGGEIIQVVTGTVVAAATSTTVTAQYVQSGIKATITPKQKGSLIAVIAVIGSIRNNTSADSVNITLFRGSTNLAASGSNTMATEQVTASVTALVPATLFKIDSPVTTSATTYEVYFQASGGGTAILSGSGIEAQVTLIEIGL